MTAAAEWFRARPVERDAARAALESAQAEVDDLRLELLLLAGVLRVLAERLVPPRCCDPSAEQRVLGWLLSGRAKAEELAELTPYDFSNQAHRRIFAWGFEVLEARERLAVDGAAWPEELDVSRDTIVRMAILDLEDRRAGARRHRALRTKVRVREYHENFRAILRALERLPYPACVPHREIDLVVSLGRAWSVVDYRFNVEPFEVPQ